jgi:integrase
MTEQSGPKTRDLPTIEQAVEAFFNDFDFGDGGKRTRLSYRSGARAFLRFITEASEFDLDTSIEELPSSISADFNSWMQTAKHTGPGPESDEGNNIEQYEGYSSSTRRLYLRALTRLLRFWWYREWLTFSPEEEDRARKALQIQRSREERRWIQTRSGDVPTDFGDRMIEVANALPLPTEEDIADPRECRKVRLETLRTRALIHTLRATALRAGDICTLSRTDVRLAHQTGGHLRIEMAKTGLAAHVVLGKPTLAVIDTYLKERNDASPWLFIQHGRTGAPLRKRILSTEAYRRRRRGYGARLSQGSVRRIVVELAKVAGYDPERDQFVSTHAFRHWHAQRLIDLGASIDEVQSVLGHARAQTTKDVYAPEPNVSQILEWEDRIQSIAGA